MEDKVSIVIAACNDERLIEDTLKNSLWASEIIVVIADESTDSTRKIAKKYTNKVYTSKNNLGIQRLLGVDKAQEVWILILDTDERVSDELKREIIEAIKVDSSVVGYYIPYQNYFLGHHVKWGNQNYKKLRLFKKNKARIQKYKTHPEIFVDGNVGTLNSYIEHYSFRSLPQVLSKFTYYAKEDSLRLLKGKKSSLKSFFLNPLHMFYTLFIADQGYRDGVWGFLLAVCFAYYEFARYLYLLKYQVSRKFRNKKSS